MTIVAHELKASYAFIERNFFLTRRYWGWELAFLVYSVAGALSISLIGVEQGSETLLLSLMIGAIFWNLVTWWYGIPSSSSHALIGGIVGAVIVKAGAGALIATGVLKTVLFIFVSPLLGFLLGALMMVAVAWSFRRASPLMPAVAPMTQTWT